MPPDEQDELLSLAQAISDRVKVDWPAERAARPELSEQLLRLERLESIVAAVTPRPARAEGHGELDPFPAGGSGSGPRSGEVQPAEARWGALELRSRLGRGGFGEVYRAYDPSLDRDVALKLLRRDAQDPLAMSRFLAEAKRLAKVRHPNVLVVHGADSHGGQVGIWTDLISGRTLEDYLAQEGTLGPREAALIGSDLCRALAAVHRTGLIHRDLKPANVMREEGGRIVLMDFGCGAELPPGGGAARPEDVQGTPYYMAPEQLRGEPVGPATDLYALGVLLYRAVSGAFPIEATSLTELARKQREGLSVPLRDRRADLPPDFVQAVERALAGRPEDRFPSAGAMERALAATLGGILDSSASLSSGEAGGRTNAGSRTLPRVGLVLLGVALLATVALMAIKARDEARSGSPTDRPVPPAAQRQEDATLGRVSTPSALTASVVLYRTHGGTTERLVEDSRVRPGDDLHLSLQSSEPVYVYVLNEDEQGNVFALFPVSGLTPANPLTPGQLHRLPGELAGTPVNWEVTSAGGRERISVLASRAPLEQMEQELRQFPTAVAGAPIQYGRLSTLAVEKVRGIGGFSRDDSRERDRARTVSELTKRATTEASNQADPWIWHISLQNPPPR